MSAKTDYLEQKILDHVLNKVTLTSPTTYVALYTAAPGETGGGTEVSGGGYARQIVYENANASTPRWNLAAAEAGGGYVVDNAQDIVFPTATADWGTIVAAAILDAATAGNMLYYGSLAANKTVGQGDTFKFAAGDLDIIER
ncbi:MAG: hypothetical protein QN183_13825 [Armatimonadota bacterium]|nr:hypothetical protein [Armatimonadota bacterium]